MKIFISWSGEASRRMAQILRSWLPSVIQSVKPFVSEEIDKGAKWFNEIMANLRGSRFGIVCLTPDNLESPWLLFEAGALANAVDTSNVTPLLVGLAPSDVKAPLGQFQLTKADQADMLRLVQSVNKVLPESLDHALLSKSFDRCWGEFQTGYEEVMKLLKSPRPKEARRDQQELVEELLELSRANRRAITDLQKAVADVTNHFLVQLSPFGKDAPYPYYMPSPISGAAVNPSSGLVGFRHGSAAAPISSESPPLEVPAEIPIPEKKTSQQQ